MALNVRGLIHPYIRSSLKHPLSLHLQQGEALGIIGKNGSGKSTFLKMLIGLINPFQGKTTFYTDFDYLGHGDGFCENLSLADHLPILGLSKKDISTFPFSHHRPIRFFSRGQKRLLALEILKASKKSLWILDEPFSNLDEEVEDQVKNFIKNHLEGGGSLVTTSHNEQEWVKILPKMHFYGL